jgi:hypothetical protein
MAVLGMTGVPRGGSESPSLIERNGTMPSTNLIQPTVLSLVKALRLRFGEELATWRAERRTQAKLASLRARERYLVKTPRQAGAAWPDLT